MDTEELCKETSQPQKDKNDRIYFYEVSKKSQNKRNRE